MKGFIIALQFMTRIPMKINIEMNDTDFGKSSKFFPLVGLVIGSILALTFLLTQNLLPLFVVGALIIILEIILTGGLHLDGFMDTMDGILSARPREQALEIMKDSRVGAHSVAAFFCLFLLKFSIIVYLPFTYMVPVLILMPMIGRWLMLFCIAFFPYAKPQGLGKIFWDQTKKSDWYLITSIIFVLLLFFLPNIFLIIPLLTFLIALTPMITINKQLLGHTGDTYGAISEISEVAFLLVCLILL